MADCIQYDGKPYGTMQRYQAYGKGWAISNMHIVFKGNTSTKAIFHKEIYAYNK